MRARICPNRRAVKWLWARCGTKVPRMPDQATTGLEQPLLEAGQRPTLDGEGQDEPPQEIAEVVGDDPEE